MVEQIPEGHAALVTGGATGIDASCIVASAEAGTDVALLYHGPEPEAELGMPDILVNSAGLNMSDTKVSDMSLDQWSRLLSVDLTGSFLTFRHSSATCLRETTPILR